METNNTLQCCNTQCSVKGIGPDRGALGCDCSTKLDAAKVSALYNAGYRYVGRYLTNVPGGKDKRMDTDEFKTISDGGLRVFPIFQQGNEFPEHFSEAQGEADAKLAVEAAKNVYIGQNATIYFAVDYDFMDYQVTGKVIPYFLGVNSVIHDTYKDEYKVGVYGSRNICTRVSDKGLATTSFVSDMSTGYSGNYGYAMPTNWAFDQYKENTFSGFGLDKDAVSGRDNGVALDTRYRVYNRQAAREYANYWYKFDDFLNHNPDYYHYQADCANFVSQCLVAGGIPMNEAWYSHKISVKGTLNSDEQMSNGSSRNSSFDVGEPWRVARKEFGYFSNSSLGYINGDVVKINNKNEISNVLYKCSIEGNPIQMGDLMYFVNDEGIAHHATMISKVENNMIYYTAHTDSQFDEQLSNHLTDEYVYIIRIKDVN